MVVHIGPIMNDTLIGNEDNAWNHYCSTVCGTSSRIVVGAPSNFYIWQSVATGHPSL